MKTFGKSAIKYLSEWNSEQQLRAEVLAWGRRSRRRGQRHLLSVRRTRIIKQRRRKKTGVIEREHRILRR